jgi:hypothetical protein
MKHGYGNNREKLIKVSKLVHFDYSWNFSNGIETAHNGEGFKRILKQMFINSPSPSLVLKSSSKGF